jgi:hypothetical protein
MKPASFTLKTEMPTAYLIIPEYAPAFFVRFVTPVMFSATRAAMYAARVADERTEAILLCEYHTPIFFLCQLLDKLIQV